MHFVYVSEYKIIFILARSLLFDFFSLLFALFSIWSVLCVCVSVFCFFGHSNDCYCIARRSIIKKKTKIKILHQMPRRPKIKQNPWIAVICDWSIYKYTCRGMNFWRCIPTWNRISNRFYRIKQTIGWILSSQWVTLTCGMWHLTWDFFRQLSRFQWDWISMYVCVCVWLSDKCKE